MGQIITVPFFDKTQTFISHNTDDDFHEKENETTINKCKDCKLCEISRKYKNTYICLCESCYKKRKNEMYKQDTEYRGDPKINEITPKLYWGNNEAAKEKTNWVSLGITNVIVAGYYLHEYYPDTFKYKTIEIDDCENENIIAHLLPAIEFIDRSEKCFVHCRAGISRSSSIVIAYIMWTNKIRYEDAYEFVKSKREAIQPNQNFERQLKEFSDILEVCEYKFRLIKEFLRSFIK